jgi:O-succinylbenzoate synthase
MTLRFQYRRYRLPLRASVRTAHEVWTEREGVVVRLQTEAGAAAFGEAAPIPAFGTETMEAVVTAAAALGEWVSDEVLDALPRSATCLRHAINQARAELLRPPEPPADPSSYRAVAALLPTGKAALARLPPRLDAGFRVFKWKVGVGDAADEMAQLDDLCALLPSGAKLRLDANGAWDRRVAERWLERCADRPIEFVEQPAFASAKLDATAARRADDLLLGLAHDFPTPIALDESIISDGDVTRWLADGWPGWFVVKPSLLGEAESTVAKLASAKAVVVFSSALETAIGARAALRAAFRWSGEKRALGFGVWPLFADARFDGPAAAPFIRSQDVERIDAEEIWNALS